MEQRIRCFVCQRHVDDQTRLSDNSEVFRQDKAWMKDSKEPSQYTTLLVNAKNLESKYFDPDCAPHWRFLYRLILYDYRDKRFLISGIGHYDQSVQTTAVPRDPNKALIGWGQERHKQGITGFYNADQLGWWDKSSGKSYKTADRRQLPLAIHMGCWKLVQWQLGPSVENNLELFAAIMLKISVESPSNLRRETYDAYRITRVQNLIEASRGRVCQTRRRKGRYLGLSRFQCLAKELLDMILDHLACKEIQGLETALGVSVAETYWRRRAALFLVEMDEIADEDLDWRYLCMRWERISNGKLFRDHHYIVGILRDQVKPTYMKNLQERIFPFLEKVIADL